MACEVKVNFSGYVPDGFGTADLVMIGGNKLRVIDFKYGKGVPVEVTDNAQMKLYALGALAQYALLYKVERVILSIAQLRLGEPAEWETTPDELYKWASEYVRPRAQQAYQRRGRVPRRRPLRFAGQRQSAAPTPRQTWPSPSSTRRTRILRC